MTAIILAVLKALLLSDGLKNRESLRLHFYIGSFSIANVHSFGIQIVDNSFMQYFIVSHDVDYNKIKTEYKVSCHVSSLKLKNLLNKLGQMIDLLVCIVLSAFLRLRY